MKRIRFSIRTTLIAIALVAIGIQFAPITVDAIRPRRHWQRFLRTDYFFVDRWHQGVFAGMFVNPRLHKKLSSSNYAHIQLDAEYRVGQVIPGGRMIDRIHRAKRCSSPLQISLLLAKTEVEYGGQTELCVKLRNMSRQNIELQGRNLRLSIAVRRRGTCPDGAVDRDDIFDSRSKDFTLGSTTLVRAQKATRLFVSNASIVSRRGLPSSMVGSSRLSIYDEETILISPGNSHALVYRVGSGWWINEYELQIEYAGSEDSPVAYVLSTPIAFDVLPPY